MKQGSNAKRRSRQTVPQPFEPIPIRPPGYFKYDAEDYELDKKFATVNVPPFKAHHVKSRKSRRSKPA